MFEEYDTVEDYVEENRNSLERVLRHSNDAFARACAWALIDAGSEPPEIDQLQRELEVLQEGPA